MLIYFMVVDDGMLAILQNSIRRNLSPLPCSQVMTISSSDKKQMHGRWRHKIFSLPFLLIYCTYQLSIYDGKINKRETKLADKNK